MIVKSTYNIKSLNNDVSLIAENIEDKDILKNLNGVLRSTIGCTMVDCENKLEFRDLSRYM